MKNDNVYIDNKFVGFEREDGKTALMKCPKCDHENYALNVLSGICTWCGFDVNLDEQSKLEEGEK